MKAEPMVPMVSLRTFVLIGLNGRSHKFEGGKATNCPKSLVNAAMEKGCVPADEAGLPVMDEGGKRKFDFQGDLRKSTLWLAIDRIVEKNNPKEFDSSGIPKVAAVSARLGFDVVPAEILEVHREYMNARNNDGVDFALDPQAENVMRVIDAEGREEILGLAKEFGLPEADQKLAVKDMRAKLLEKFGGVVR